MGGDARAAALATLPLKDTCSGTELGPLAPIALHRRGPPQLGIPSRGFQGMGLPNPAPRPMRPAQYAACAPSGASSHSNQGRLAASLGHPSAIQASQHYQTLLRKGAVLGHRYKAQKGGSPPPFTLSPAFGHLEILERP